MSDTTPQLRFPEFVDSWQDQQLGDIAELTSSKRVYLSDYVSNGVPFYRGKEISEIKKNIIPDDILYISNKAYEDFKNKFGAPIKNEILITAVGTLGNILRVKDDKPFYFKDGNLIWLKNINQNPYYLEIVLENNKNKLLQSAIGSSQKALTIVELKKIKLKFPNKLEQQKIADFLTVVDDKISGIDKKIELLKKYKKSVMQKIFTQQIRFKDKNDNFYLDWTLSKLGQLNIYVADGNYGEMYPTASEMLPSGVPFIRANNIKNGRLVWDDMKYISPRLHETLISGHIMTNDILITTRGDIGSLAFVDKEFNNANINAQICLLRPEKSINPKYLFYFLSTKMGRSQFIQLQTGSALKQLPKGKLSLVNIHTPEIEEQQRIANFLTKLDDRINLELQNLKLLKKFKKSLLQRMFI